MAKKKTLLQYRGIASVPISYRIGSSGGQVREIQQALAALGYPVSVDGRFGGETQKALIAYQKKMGLAADGVAGSATLSSLKSGSAANKTVLTGTGVPGTAAKSVMSGTAKKQPVAGAVNKAVLTNAPAQPGAVDKSVLSGQGAATLADKSVLSGTSEATRPSLAMTPGIGSDPSLPTSVANPQGAASVGAGTATTPAPANVVNPQLSAAPVPAPVPANVVNPQLSAQPLGPNAAPTPMPTPQPIQWGPQNAPANPSTIPSEAQQAAGGTSTPAGTPTPSTGIPAPSAPPINNAPPPAGGGGGGISAGQQATVTETTPGATGAPTVPGSELAPTVGTSTTGNVYLDQLNQMQFSYDPSQDQEYLLASSTLENQVAQMMVSRGGLYSSITQSMLTTKLITLQMEMRSQAYKAFTDQRDFLLSQAKFEQERMNDRFNQEMQVANYNLNVEKEQFDQQMALANYNLQAQAQKFSQSMQRANYNLKVAQANAAAQKAQAEVDLKRQKMDFNLAKATYDRDYGTTYDALKQWQADGLATPEVAEVFAEYGNFTFRPQTYAAKAIAAKLNDLENQKNYLSSWAYQLEDNDAYLNLMTNVFDYKFDETPAVKNPMLAVPKAKPREKNTIMPYNK